MKKKILAGVLVVLVVWVWAGWLEGQVGAQFPETYNWTGAAETKNDENILVILDEDIVEMFEKKFEEYWKK